MQQGASEARLLALGRARRHMCGISQIIPHQVELWRSSSYPLGEWRVL